MSNPLSIERVVALGTPLFAAVSAWLAGLIVQLPGHPHLDAGQLTALQITIATTAAAAAIKWLHGRSKWTTTVAALAHDVQPVVDSIPVEERAGLVRELERVIQNEVSKLAGQVGGGYQRVPVPMSATGMALGNAGGSGSMLTFSTPAADPEPDFSSPYDPAPASSLPLPEQH